MNFIPLFLVQPVRTLASRSASMLSHHRQQLANLFILAMPGYISCSSWIILSLPCDRSTPKYTTIQHTQLFPPPTLLHSSLWLLKRPTVEHKLFHFSQYCVFVSPSLDLLGCDAVSKYSRSKRDWNNRGSLRKWQMACIVLEPGCQIEKQSLGLELYTANKMYSLASRPSLA